MHILYCANEPYFFPMAVSLFSAVQHADAPLSATLAVEGIDTRSKAALRSLFPDTDVRIRSLPPNSGAKWPIAIFARLLIDRLVPRDTDTALYLDCDTLVLADVNELAHSVRQGAIVSAVQDDFANRMHGWSGYFNSGVICVDIPAWRSAGIGATAMELVVGNGMSDQHALNTAMADHWTRLDPRWNVMTHYYAPSARWDYATAARDSAAIRHFTMSKPWRSTRKGMGAARFHAAAEELREVNDEAWLVLREAAGAPVEHVEPARPSR